MLWRDGPMTVALGRSVISTICICLIIVWQGDWRIWEHYKWFRKRRKVWKFFMWVLMCIVHVQRRTQHVLVEVELVFFLYLLTGSFCKFMPMEKLKCMFMHNINPRHSQSHLPQWHLWYLLGPVMACFHVAENSSKLRHRSILQWTMFTMIPNLNSFRFARSI